MTHSRSPLCLAALLLLATSVTGCGEQNTTLPDSTAGSPGWLVEAAPADAVSVKQAKASSEAGDTITMRGRIGGRMEPIAGDSPVFTVMDLSVPSCADIGEDHCPKPWDYCCEAPESVRENAATVQIIGADGTPVSTSLTDAGLAPLDEVIVMGRVGARPSPDTLTIQASQVHRVTK